MCVWSNHMEYRIGPRIGIYTALLLIIWTQLTTQDSKQNETECADSSDIDIDIKCRPRSKFIRIKRLFFRTEDHSCNIPLREWNSTIYDDICSRCHNQKNCTVDITGASGNTRKCAQSSTPDDKEEESADICVQYKCVPQQGNGPSCAPFSTTSPYSTKSPYSSTASYSSTSEQLDDTTTRNTRSVALTNGTALPPDAARTTPESLSIAAEQVEPSTGMIVGVSVAAVVAVAAIVTLAVILLRRKASSIPGSHTSSKENIMSNSFTERNIVYEPSFLKTNHNYQNGMRQNGIKQDSDRNPKSPQNVMEDSAATYLEILPPDDYESPRSPYAVVRKTRDDDLVMHENTTYEQHQPLGHSSTTNDNHHEEHNKRTYEQLDIVESPNKTYEELQTIASNGDDMTNARMSRTVEDMPTDEQHQQPNNAQAISDSVNMVD